MKVGNNTAATLILNTGAPQGVYLVSSCPPCPYHQQTIMVKTHQDSCEEGTTTPFSPQKTEKIWHRSPDPQKVLQLHHREHPDRLKHRLKTLQRVVNTTQYITGTKLPDIQDLLYILGGVRGRPQKLSKTPVTQVIDCSLSYRTASGTGTEV